MEAHFPCYRSLKRRFASELKFRACKRSVREDIEDKEEDLLDEDLSELMGKAIKSAFDSLDPGVLLMLKLSYLHGVSQTAIARMWQCDQTRVSRSLTSAREQIASQTMQFINESDNGLELEWEDFQKLCAAGLDL